MLNPEIARIEVTRHILRAFDIHASKRLGQNFLVNPSVVKAIVETAEIKDDDRVLEIGPGIGTLTQGLLEAGARVTAVEMDKKLPAVLRETLKGYDKFELVEGDILKVDIASIMGDGPCKVVANLPYYITTPIIMTLLERRLPISRIVTMVQKEVADRMIASPGGKDYGALSIAVQYYTEPEMVMTVGANSFMPSPAVESAVMDCVVRDNPPVSVRDEKMFFLAVKAAFAQRRKTLGNAIQGVGVTKEMAHDALMKAGIDPQRRGETLSIEEFARLADSI